MDASKYVLLTGAGFTHNMGGYLGSEMDSVVSNHKLIRSNKSLKNLMLSELKYSGNFESAYGKVLKDSLYTKQDQEDMKTAIVDAYKDMHEEIMNFRDGDHSEHFNFRNLASLVNFFNRGGEQYYIFTLNQDLFFEYWFNWHSPAAPKIGSGNPLTDLSSFQQLPAEVSESDVDKGVSDHAGPAYMKLHGSYGWLSSNGGHSLVIGTQKEEQIINEPLLKWYYQYFRDLLLRRKFTKLLIIGYGFGDPHINEILTNAVQVNCTSLYIINPRNQGSFIRNMEEKGLVDIAEGIECYYPWKLKDIFYKDGSKKWAKIEEDLLGD